MYLFLSPTSADRLLSSADASEFIKKETSQLPGEVELLIIGSGAAGLSCAVRAAELGVKSIFACRKRTSHRRFKQDVRRTFFRSRH